MTYFPWVGTWCVPEAAIVESMQEMARDGCEGREGIALWLGARRQGIAEISHLVFLRGEGIVKEPNQIIVTSNLLNDVADLAIGLGLTLLGQIHSHGKWYGTDLSPADRGHGITVPYYLSIVAPDYALRPNTGIGECGVHILEPNKGYRRLSAREISKRLHLLPDTEVSILTAGWA